MLALATRDIPERRFNHSGIERIAQDVVNLLRPDFALGVLREAGNGFQMALHFGLRAKLSAREALHYVLNDRGKRLVSNDDLAALRAFGELVADGHEERMKAALDSSLHLLDRLALVLDALQLSLGGDDGLNELAFRRVLELEVQAFGPRSVLGELRAQANVEFCIPREALEIVKNDDVSRAFVFA